MELSLLELPTLHMNTMARVGVALQLLMLVKEQELVLDHKQQVWHLAESLLEVIRKNIMDRHGLLSPTLWVQQGML